MTTNVEAQSAGRIHFATEVSGLAAVAAVTSMGAGAIHAAAVGAHSEHRQAVVAFTAVAVFQIGWGALALVRRHPLLLLVGLIGNIAALGGWLMAKTGGISFVEGLEAKESIQLADGMAAALATIAVLAGVLALWPRTAGWRADPLRLANLGVAVLIAAVVGMLAAGSHAHSAGDDHSEVAAGHGHDDPAAGGAAAVDDAHDDEAHDDDDAHSAPSDADAASAEHSDDHAAAGTDAASAEHSDDHAAAGSDAAAAMPPAPSVVPPKPYIPTQPIDLSGVEGVTPEQQARAENLIAITLLRLPQFADPAYAETLGFRSIGDGATGHEHYINREYLNDGWILNPDYPESLVYDTTVTPKKLVSVMFMLEPGTTLDTVPDVGGALTQWHIHDNLCFTTDPEAPKVAGLTDAAGNCPAHLTKVTSVPMIHVWITEHPCGPFASLEGVGAGSIRPGEERLCDTAHGAGH